MNLLIVDDEYYSVESLRASIDWVQLGIERVFSAYSMQQAQEIFQLHSVDIMISDIEMPKGSGLDLLKWVRENGYNTVTVFLTSFANFDYANNAIKLQSIDYLLKPIDSRQLNDCMLTAVNKVRQLEVQELYEQNSKNWNNSRKKLEEQFWNNLSTQIIPEEPDQILNELKQYCLPKALYYQSFYIILLNGYIKCANDRWELNLYEYAIKNVINELLEAYEVSPVITRLNEKQYAICLKKTEIHDRSNLFQLSNKIIQALSISLPGIFQIYIDGDTSMLHTGRAFKVLSNYSRNIICEDSKVIDTTLPTVKSSCPKIIPKDEWSDLLMLHKKTEMKEQALRFLKDLQASKTAERSDLLRFNHDFIQIIYSILEKNGESAHRLFNGNTSEQIFEQACSSIETMKIWVFHVIDVFDECLLAINQSDSSIDIIKRYIREHLGDELSRKTLASLVYLSPDYLSHVFREKTGESLTAYILAERMKKSKELLLTSQMSIRDVALSSGFPNISYFSRQFKNITGKTPQVFRKTGVNKYK